LEALPSQGVAAVQVVCPGFSADCLETIEEIGMENRDIFLEAGGARYEYIPCLNAQATHLDALTNLLSDELTGWVGGVHDPATTKQLADKLGAEQ
jgi:ferrochelatase